MIVTLEGQPRPVSDAAFNASTVTGAISAIVTALVMVGVITATQANTVAIIAGAVLTIIAAVAPFVSGWHTVRTAEPQVTPLSSPRDNAGVPLVSPAQAGSQGAPGSTLRPPDVPPVTPGTP